MFEALKKTIGVCLMGLGLRNITSIITSYYWMAIYNRSINSYPWNYVAFFKKIEYLKGDVKYEDCSKKSTKMFKRTCKIIIWN